MFVRYYQPELGKHVIERCNSIRKMDRRIRIFYSCRKMEIKYRDIPISQFDFVVSTIKGVLGGEKELRKPIKEKMKSNFTD